MTEDEGIQTEKTSNLPTKEVISQKIDVRNYFRVSRCGSKGLHIWIPPHLVKNFDLQPGDELYLKIESVNYSNIREILAV